METPETIKMRGHHLIGLGALISGKLKDTPEEDVKLGMPFKQVLENILGSQKVTLVAGKPDYICDLCNKQEDACFAAPGDDRNVAKDYGLRIGIAYLVSTVVERLKERYDVTKEKLKSIQSYQ